MTRTTKTLLINIVFIILAIGVYKLFPNIRTKNLSAPTKSASTLSGTIGATVPEQTGQCHMNGELPDAKCTPGVIDPRVVQSNIDQTICASGYSKSIRPPVSYTDSLKTQQMQQYGFTDSIRLHEEDHLISLELGGSPTDPKNIWPEPHASPNPKDNVEDFLHAAVCNGRVSLHEAQQRIAVNWTTAEQGL